MVGDLPDDVDDHPVAAIASLREVLKRDPLNADAYRLLARALRAADQDGTKPQTSGAVTSDPVRRAAQALQQDDLETAEIILRPRLRERPNDADALTLLGRFASRLGYVEQADSLLRLAIECAPSNPIAKFHLAAELYRRNRAEEAIPVVGDVLRDHPDDIDAINLNAAAHARAGQLDEAATGYEKSLRLQPGQPHVWSWYGHTLRSLGRTEDGIAAVRQGIELAPESGELWWSLSEFKTHRFDPGEIDRMRRAAAHAPARSQDRIYFDFAIGKGMEDLGDYANAFAAYAEGNALQKSGRSYDPDQVTRYVAHCAALLPRGFADRLSPSASAAGPVFILGMPRSGSTLLEQMLGRHPAIEATMELPDFINLAEGLTDKLEALPAWMESAATHEAEALGEAYAAGTRRYRSTAKPWFIDKMPNNWLYVPLILWALPQARIIDIRRHPLDCCMSNYKQLFLSLQEFSNDLDWVGRFYRDYVDLMRSVDESMPNRVHRVIYEQLVEDPEREIRGALDYIGVAFNAACLSAAGHDQVVRTASADQVRQPLNRAGIGSWRAFEPWLAPLVQALGPVLESYSAAPAP
jgi:tetratricopeptide (TPR) repeat protein